jgi:acyl-CoA thioesterase-2
MTAEDQPGEWDVEAERANMYALLTGVKPGDAPGTFVGDVPNDWEEVMFGGCVIGQSITAVTRDAPEATRTHSFHGYFLRPALSGTPIDYTVATIRDGRAFSQRRVTARQNGKDVFEAMCSFTTDVEEAYLYDLPHTSELPPLPETPDGFGLAGFEASYLGATEQRSDGTYESTERKWFRLPMDIGDDPHLHAAYFAMASDWTGLGSRPLKMEFEEDRGFPVASLDHALWFHRPARVTDWHLIDLHSLVNYGGRGLIRLTMRDTEGRVVASAAQELLLR